MAKYKVSFKKHEGTDTREYGLIVEADILGDAETRAPREIRDIHAKRFLSEQNIIIV